MATVTIERDEKHGTVAVKRLADGANKNRLGWEVSILERLRHPGVVELVDSTSVVVRTRFVSSHSLVSCSVGGADEVAGLGIRLARTLADLHDVGIVHHRITADHVLIGRGGQPVLCGLAEATTDGVGSRGDVAGLVELLYSLMHQGPQRPWWRRRSPAERALQRVLDSASFDEAPNLTMRELASGLVQTVSTARLPEVRVEETPMASVPSPEAKPDDEPLDVTPPAVDESWNAQIRRAIDLTDTGHTDPGHTDVGSTDGGPADAGHDQRREASVLAGLGSGSEDPTMPTASQTSSACSSEKFRPPAGKASLGDRFRRSNYLAGIGAAVVIAGIVLLWPRQSSGTGTEAAEAADQTRAPIVHSVVSSSTTLEVATASGDGLVEQESNGAELEIAPAGSAAVDHFDDADLLVQASISEGDNRISYEGATFSVGEPGDLLTLGEFGCDGRSLAALFRPNTGEVFVFRAWAEESASVEAELISVVPDGISIDAGSFQGSCQEIQIGRTIGEPAVIVLDEETT